MLAQGECVVCNHIEQFMYKSLEINMWHILWDFRGRGLCSLLFCVWKRTTSCRTWCFFFAPKLQGESQTITCTACVWMYFLAFAVFLFFSQVHFNVSFVNLNISLFWEKSHLVLQQRPAAASVDHVSRRFQTTHLQLSSVSHHWRPAELLHNRSLTANS